MINISNKIRKTFLKFFHEKDHTILPGSSLVPKNDPSLLFTNAGMNQFKNVFLGIDCNFKYTRVVTLQNCLRTGGKHNDFENVGYTSQHHTFFEMLGNFSFGNYFKLDAIKYAWEFLTSKKQLNLSKEKLWITVYMDDLESLSIWKNIIKVDSTKIIKIGNKKNYYSDNFWQMGETGPCGPSTEIFYDRGDHLPGQPPGNNNKSDPRFIEIWNIVFIQFNKLNDGRFIKLTKPFVDTGMGLERISTILHNVNSNYEIDLFQPIIKYILKLSNKKNVNDKSLYVIADHIRACAFIISENIVPSNDYHGYVLRKIIRRAIRHGHKIGIKSLFLYKLVPILIRSMNQYGQILEKKQKIIENVLKLEESKFIITLEKGLKLLTSKIKDKPEKILNGNIAFTLYETFGFPIDLTVDICKDHNISVDYLEFQKCMNEHKKNSKNIKLLTKEKKLNIESIETKFENIFVGYKCSKTTSIINNIIINNVKTIQIIPNQEGIIFLNKTPFYGESGGQIGDSGIIYNNFGKFLVNDTKIFGKKIGHIGKLITGCLNIYNTVHCEIDFLKRKLIQINHSATHLLHASLKKILGNHVAQKGSLVSDHCFRFDFLHNCAMTLYEIHSVETIVNDIICQNVPIQETITSLSKIQDHNITALFPNKYKKKVRLISINNFSIELCKGTHTSYTGNIGLFKIISEKGVSSGIRRIEAITGKTALSKIHNEETEIQDITTILKTTRYNLKQEVIKLFNNTSSMEKKICILNNHKINNIVNELHKNCLSIKTIKLIIKNFKNESILLLRSLIDKLKNKLQSSVIIITSCTKNKTIIIVGITDNITKKLSATEILNKLIKNLGGKGGGKPHIAEGKIENITKLHTEFEKLKQWIALKL